jgi:ATP-dependent DNA helicase RecQ
VIQVLLGSKEERILQQGHDRLSTYGIGSELNKMQWGHLARQMIRMGYLDQADPYQVLSLTPKAYDALKNRSPIMGRIQEAKERAARKARETELEYDRALFDLLRARRKQLADEAGVPPYVIFSDRALIEMAAYFPQSPERMLDISGVGQVKARQHGETFLAIIRDYCRERAIPERLKEVRIVRDDSGRRYTIIGEAFNRGESVQSLMQRYQVTAGTILDHLTRYAAAGHPLRRDDALLSLTSASPDQQAAAFAAFGELGTAYLKPVFDKLEGLVSYDELKTLRLCYLTRAE